jgi:uncharacterized protein (DUF433 family)
MTIAIQSESPPIRADASGALRVGDTRVLLELVVHSFREGATPETIVQQYPTLILSDVYAVIGYALRHPEQIDTYLTERERCASEVQRRIEAGQGDLKELRERLASRRPG